MPDNSENLNLKVQPQAIEAEQAVLGSMLSSKVAVSRVLEILKSDAFYKDSHVKIFSTMVDLFNEGEPIDVVSLTDRLKKNKLLETAGGSYYLTGLMSSVPTTANVDHYARIVLEKSNLRNLIDISAELTKSAFVDTMPVDDIIDEAERKIFAIAQHRMKGSFQHLNPVMQETFEELDRIHQKPGSVTGVPTGLIDVDEITSGLQKGDMVIIAGRPGMGKTALSLTIARNAALDYNEPVGIFSLEMSNHQLAMRLLCAEARVDSHLVRTGKLPKQQWKQLSLSVGKLAEAPIYLDDTPAMNVTELRAKARRLKSEHNISMFIVDYIQLMTGPRSVESRQQEISQISRSLKALAKELDVPVVCVSQLSRAVESRSDKKPLLSDLRESGAIEQDADLVMFLFRKFIYTEDEEDRGKAQIIIAKQRNGPTGSRDIIFVDRYARFENATLYEDLETEVPF
tara:strand:+ start:2505 stop:3872 length:1368 start_codon:yes stop_codon:yes gene_type:complete